MSIVPFTIEGLERFAVQELSRLTECRARDMSKEFDQANHWVNNFILNSIFVTGVKPEFKPHIFGYLRRAQMAILEYENGRAALLDYLAGTAERLSAYFRALYHFENAVALLCQSYKIVRLMAGNARLYEGGDGSAVERLHSIYNISKHLEPASIPDGYLHAVWIRNDGLVTGRATLSWDELAELILDIGRTADEMSDPSRYSNKDDEDDSGSER